MRHQTYLVRKAGRYHFRRRLPWGSGVPGTITVSLGTADPVEARRLARWLASKWDETTMFMSHEFERQTLTIEERRRIFRSSLEQEVALATAAVWNTPAHPSTHKVLAAAYEIIQRVSPDAGCLCQEDLDAVINENWSAKDRDLLEKTLRILISPSSVD